MDGPELREKVATEVTVLSQEKFVIVEQSTRLGLPKGKWIRLLNALL